jgi:hypothetical protein
VWKELKGLSLEPAVRGEEEKGVDPTWLPVLKGEWIVGHRDMARPGEDLVWAVEVGLCFTTLRFGEGGLFVCFSHPGHHKLSEELVE